MKVIYIAGAYSSDCEWGRWQNIQHASEVARKLWLEGWAVICPHRNTMFFGTNHDGDKYIWIKGDLEILKRCDAIYMLRGWKESEGAVMEYHVANERGMGIYFE